MELVRDRDESLYEFGEWSSFAFIYRALYGPVLAVGSLWLLLIFYQQPVGGLNFLLMVLAFFGSAYLIDDSRINRIHRFADVIGVLVDSVIRWLCIIGFIWTILYSAGMSNTVDARVWWAWLLITPFTIFCARPSIVWLLVSARTSHSRPCKAVIIGATEMGLRLEEQFLNHPQSGVDIVGFFEDRGDGRETFEVTSSMLGTTADLPGYVAEHEIHRAYITLPMTRHPRILELLDSLKNSTLSIYFVPDVFIYDLIQARIEVVNGIPLVAVCESPFFGLRGAIKRCCDLFLASLLLLALWPLMLAIAAGVAASSPGPIFFRQRRYGLDGKEITVYKFRTMVVCEDGQHIAQATRHDSRITRLGSMLRKTSLDELPQLINVVQGRMSLVGPRPHAVAHNEMYRHLIKGYMVRHKVRPGITGLAQVSGCRGETDSIEKMQARIDLDIDYLRNWSLGLDFSILLRTLKVIAGDQNAY